ncbi:MAG: ABC transporter ATP-binding protein [Deltaproteobacteria bacterium]|nr:ABC transporter ATP-binding protein [Deltaproteobacteria bacterium]
MSSSLIQIVDLTTELFLESGTVRVVDGISLSLNNGETLALVGESGCGKTMTAYSIMRLVPAPPGKITGGKILFDGDDLLTLSERDMRKIRGDRIAMIFQEPLTSLNPVFKIGSQIAEVLQLHRGMKKKAALECSVSLLQDVGIPSPQQRINDYPHQMSGGMRQRVMIAMALACEPDLVIADEPTTALDVTVQAQIMELLKQLQQKKNMALLLITHDLGVVAETAHRVAVMYAGRIMEYADVQTLFAGPLNPYTQGLLASLPHFGQERLRPIKGMVPALFDLPAGCKFCTRCDDVFDRCMQQEPPLIEVTRDEGKQHLVRCWKYAKS